MAEPGPYVVNVWDLIWDPDVPQAVVQRALNRGRAAAMGVPVPSVPDEDLPFLARHARPVRETRGDRS